VQEDIFGIKINAYLIVKIYFRKALVQPNKLAYVNHFFFGITKLKYADVDKIKD
jgi:hypothetical protein